MVRKKEGSSGKGRIMAPPRLKAMPDKGINDNAPSGEEGSAGGLETPVAASQSVAPQRPEGLPSNIAALPSADRREKLRILEALLRLRRPGRGPSPRPGALVGDR